MQTWLRKKQIGLPQKPLLLFALPGSALRVVLDTNVIVSAMLSPTGTPGKLLSEIRKRDDIAMVAAEPLLEEYERALSYTHVQRLHRLTPSQIALTIDALRFQASPVTLLPEISAVAHDSDDNLIVACAVGGNADFIVSGDRHLLRLKVFRDITILSPAAFLFVISEQTSS